MILQGFPVFCNLITLSRFFLSRGHGNFGSGTEGETPRGLFGGCYTAAHPERALYLCAGKIFDPMAGLDNSGERLYDYNSYHDRVRRLYREGTFSARGWRGDAEYDETGGNTK